VSAQAGKLGPRMPTVGGAEERGVLGPGVDGIGVRERWLQVPDALEFPRVRGAVIPLVRASLALVGELVADQSPRLAAVLGALDLLAEPAARLGGIDAVGIGGRAFEVVDFPAREMRALHRPRLARTIGAQDERALTCPHQNPHTAHSLLLPAEGRPWEA